MKVWQNILFLKSPLRN